MSNENTSHYPAAIAYKVACEAINNADSATLCRALSVLAKAYDHAPSEVDGCENWDLLSIGEFSEYGIGELLVGAYWALSHCHSGQASPSYAAMCAIGAVYDPGASRAPDNYSSEREAYEAVCEVLAPGYERESD